MINFSFQHSFDISNYIVHSQIISEQTKLSNHLWANYKSIGYTQYNKGHTHLLSAAPDKFRHRVGAGEARIQQHGQWLGFEPTSFPLQSSNLNHCTILLSKFEMLHPMFHIIMPIFKCYMPVLMYIVIVSSFVCDVLNSCMRYLFQYMLHGN